MTGYRALVLDFGGPVLKTEFELLREAEERLGLPAGTFTWTGPFDPAADEDWRLMQAQQISERDYWTRKAADFAEIMGGDGSVHEMNRAFYDGPADDFLRKEALALVDDAHAAGLVVGVLTNDLRAFHPPEWVDQMHFLTVIDALVDGSVEKVMKPDPRIYAMITDLLGVRPEECVFVDDQPRNVAGGEAVGMTAVRFDVTDPGPSFATVRDLLRL